MDDLEALRELDTPERVVRASELITAHQERMNEASRIRREGLLELVSSGMSREELATLLGVTVQRVAQLLTSGPRPERALLGVGKLTIAIGSKTEAHKQHPSKANPRSMVSSEAFAAYELISAASRELGLQADYKVVPPPGFVDLNQANLVVLTSPKLLPIVGQVLASDPHLEFGESAQGWYLADRQEGVTYRSPSDSGECRDYGYLGRLPRPDRKGTFLYVAGIHAMGTLGAAHHLVNNIDDLYAEVKARRFSCVVSCDYDPDTHAITSTSLLTPIYQPKGRV